MAKRVSSTIPLSTVALPILLLMSGRHRCLVGKQAVASLVRLSLSHVTVARFW